MLDERTLPVGRLLNTVGRGGESGGAEPRRPQMRTTYLDDELRVSRTEDEHYFVFTRAVGDEAR